MKSLVTGIIFLATIGISYQAASHHIQSENNGLFCVPYSGGGNPPPRWPVNPNEPSSSKKCNLPANFASLCNEPESAMEIVSYPGPGCTRFRCHNVFWLPIICRLSENCSPGEFFDEIRCTPAPPPDKGAGGCMSGGGVGNPCFPANGNKYQREVDYQSSMGLNIIRYYNSNLSDRDVSMGKGWTDSFTTKRIKSVHSLIDQGANGNNIVWIYEPNGKSVKFESMGLGWVTDADTDVTFSVTATEATVGRPNGNLEKYSLNGNLESEKTSAGKTKIYTYNTIGNLESVTDHFGKMVTLTWTNNKRISSIVDPHGGIYTYAYDSNSNLESVTYPDNTIRQYHYEDTNLPNHLTGITDENGDRFATFAFDSEGRAISTEHAAIDGNTEPQEKFQIDYGQ